MNSSPRNILFITWDGPDTSYLEGLFLPIFVRLKAYGFLPHVLQFSWGEQAVHAARTRHCRSVEIPYRHVPVLRFAGSAGAVLTALQGTRHIRRAIRDWRIDALMPRSLMPALAVLRLSQAERSKVSLVFDADGLPADERVDFGGLSPHSLTYRALRDIESEMLRQADSVLCRTESAKSILLARSGAGVRSDNFYVVPNGKDPFPFTRALASSQHGGRSGVRLCYCGSIGGQYRVPEMLSLAVFLRRSVPDLTLDIFSSSTAQVDGVLQGAGLAQEDWISCRSLAADQVPTELAKCDVGLAFRERSFSMQAVQPIKLGEYLMAGLPIIGTPDIGGAQRLVREGVFRSSEIEDRDQTLHWILHNFIPRRNDIRKLCHEVGVKYFSIDETVLSYVTALRRLAPE